VRRVLSRGQASRIVAKADRDRAERIEQAVIVTLVANGFLDDNWRDGLAVAGVAVTVVGFTLALWAILNAGSAAKRAEHAAQEAREDIRRSVRLGELRSANRMVSEILALVMSDRLEAAVLRLDDLRRSVVEARAVARVSTHEDFTQCIALVGSLQASVLKKHRAGDAVDAVYVNGKLMDISNFLGDVATKIELGSEDDRYGRA